MRIILGLDLGPNSIGWAKVSVDDEDSFIKDIRLGSRIIPMSQDVMSSFDAGVTESQTKARTGYRGARRLWERVLLRRERMHRVLHVLGFLPEHYDQAIGWDRTIPTTYGKFLNHGEPKLAWARDAEGKMRFLFNDSFEEMLLDFEINQPELVANGKKIPMDWTLYYLRKKALTAAISKEELAWILLNFNQKRGYYQLRGEEEEENPTQVKEYHELKVVRVEATEERRGSDRWYNVVLENGWIYRRSSKISLDDWVGKTKAFIVTTEYEKDGKTLKKDKDGQVKRSFRVPDENDWTLRKKRTEHLLEDSGKTVGAFIYDHLLKEPSDKIRGKYVRTIERNYYKDELRAILQKQAEYHSELSDPKWLEACVRELYPNNQPHRDSLLKKDMVYLLLEDLLFYQRPLKSKKSLIADCPYEHYEYVDKNTGEIKSQPIKCIARSNPYFQEFRLWQFVQNLRLFDRADDHEVTGDYLKTPDDYARLFDYLNDRKEIGQDMLLKDYFKLKKVKTGGENQFPVRWNYVDDNEKKYPCNETRHVLLSALDKAGMEKTWLDSAKEYRLWHLLYSVEHKDETRTALRKLVDDDRFVEAFLKVKPFAKDYGAYSEKAIKKLLAVMRMGYLWREDEVRNRLQPQMEKIARGELDEKVIEKISNSGFTLQAIDDYQGLPVWLACYVVYGRHSEATDIQHWQKPEDLLSYIKAFKQHSLRNPIVEACVLETLRTVYDIWKEAGHIDEIHVELGREMKSPANERARRTRQILQNENTNLRIKRLLMELKNDSQIQDVRPYSPMQQEILRIYEEGALQTLSKEDENYAEIIKISQMAQPTTSELTRYKLWLEQKYCSPYTGRTISLSKLFTSAYQIEHVIPQSRYFDDSFSNKVICEAEVNALKSNLLGHEFIKQHGSEIVHCTTLGDRRILSEEEYLEFVKEHYQGNRAKKEKLLMEEIPQDFLNRQLNDSRYISKMVKTLLSNIVRQQDEAEATSKMVIACTGGITDKLKKDWGLNDVWNTIVSSRFQRMNALTESEQFGHWENKDGKQVFQTTMPLELQRGFNKKRIDHRHHAMDALVIACASRNIINYLNNESANDTRKREDLRRKLCDKNRVIRKPWDTFTQDVYEALSQVVVSFKNYVRVINKATNYYEKYDDQGRKVRVPQKGNDLWAVRKPMHKETVFGHVNLKRKAVMTLSKAIDHYSTICYKPLRQAIAAMSKAGLAKKDIVSHFKKLEYKWNDTDVSKVEVWVSSDDREPMVATRKPLKEDFDEKKISSISDTGIQKILLNYLKAKGGDPQVAFTPEGIADMNQHIRLYNDGKFHQPIVKVRIVETLGNKFAVGHVGHKSEKFVEAQSGTNLYFAIYQAADGQRSYATIPLNIVVERLKQGLSPVPEKNDNDEPLKFYLSPNDLVYVPTEEESLAGHVSINANRIYKFMDSSGITANFVPHRISSLIYNVDKKSAETYCHGKLVQNELGLGSQQLKNQRAISGEMIKAICWKLEVDRLGNVVNIQK